MDRLFIERLHIENYGCIQRATFKLTPLHAIVGPNDSGKSTALRAIQTLARLLGPAPIDEEQGRLFRAFMEGSPGGTVLIDAATSRIRLCLDRDVQRDYSFKMFHSASEVSTSRASTVPSFNWADPSLLRDMIPPKQRPPFEGATLLRLDPNALREPNTLIPEGQPLRFRDEKGLGLAAVYDALITRDITAFLELNKHLCHLFPAIKSVSLTNPTATTKAIGVKLTSGAYIPAERMSDGMLYAMAFAALPHLDLPAILLVEEPENGLHPARITEVMRVLREVSKTRQVLIASHSPLVINELLPDEVTAVRRSAEGGTIATPLMEVPSTSERAKAHALSGLAMSCANGDDDTPIALSQSGAR